MHVPVDVVVKGLDVAREAGADGCVAMGGGSAIGLDKAMALKSQLPLLAVPTTYAGSEMARVWGLTEDGRKRTGRAPSVLPRSVLYDPELTLDLPVDVSVTSGFNAIAHAMEALYAHDASPETSLMAEEGVRSLAGALPAIAGDSRYLDARTEALRGAWLCGSRLGATTMSRHHKLCHVLGGPSTCPTAPPTPSCSPMSPPSTCPTRRSRPRPPPRSGHRRRTETPRTGRRRTRRPSNARRTRPHGARLQRSDRQGRQSSVRQPSARLADDIRAILKDALRGALASEESSG